MRRFTNNEDGRAMRVLAVIISAVALFLASPSLYASGTEEVDFLFDTVGPEDNLEPLLEELADLRRQKIPINEATAEDLLHLPWLTSEDARRIIEGRRRAPIRNLEALTALIGGEKARRCLPYIVFEKDLTLRRQALRDKVEGSLYTRWFTEYPERRGITDGSYAGDNYKLYNRLQLAVPHLKASVVQEKDVGEADLDDFTSFSLNAYDLGILKSAVLGNYTLNFGEGLVMGQNRYFSKGSDPAGSVRLRSRRLSPYSSSAEYGFLQGAAATLRPGDFELTAFTSSNRVDGRIGDTGLITSFDDSGYHRTELETSRMDNVTEEASGANLLWNFSTGAFDGRIGASLVHYRYSEPLAALVEEGYSAEEASSASLTGIEAALSTGRVGAFMEAAFSEKPDDASWTGGVSWEPVSGVSAVAAVRRYGARYSSPFAGAFAERGDDASNEEGYYAGIDVKLSRKVQLGAYYDRFRFPELSSDYLYPSEGHDMRLFAVWKASRSLKWTMQLQHKRKEEAVKQCPLVDGEYVDCGDDSEDKVYTAVMAETDRLRLDCDLKVARGFSARTRGEVKRVTREFYSGTPSYDGWLAYEQLNYSAGRLGLKWRGTLFNTDSSDATLYAYEDGLPMQFDLGSYNGRGKSMFFLASWKARAGLKLVARYEVTSYSDREVYSSGDDQRATDSPASLHLGCLWSF
ncbi:helix-hairpin-helix domain-containing protein [Chlorobium sp. N1]|uniref:helix-hairpin-helix domain-containing protein n=1 Tax=Chlorobium sp. N1 TaxID=2491138 RepID=UPI001F601BA8|nr:helix-hairpin-helix domain-containing protein [Chlorobium sp. N1]